MKHVSEYRDPASALRLASAIRAKATRPWTIMEVCGGQTHTIVRSGIERLLSGPVALLHGPGCPVCVTPVEMIDKAIDIAARPGVVFCSFGDMLRVPGSERSLLDAKAAGADVRILYSPLDSLEIARREAGRQVVFFAVGFETTAPANAMTVRQAARLGIDNLSLLVAHFRIPPAMEAILASPGCRVEAFLAAGHVCTVMGYAEYEPLARRYQVPIVVTGFEPLDILQGILMAVEELERGRTGVVNQYRRAVKRGGNPAARALIREVFEVVPRSWRGVGTIPKSGLRLREAYRRYDAEARFAGPGAGQAGRRTHGEATRAVAPGREESRQEMGPAICIAGQVLQGNKKPSECPAFGTLCTPEFPLGAPMVSSEGACAAYYLYGRQASS
jgi:hydrogenase expression/formation protein HypD